MIAALAMMRKTLRMTRLIGMKRVVLTILIILATCDDSMTLVIVPGLTIEKTM